MDQPRSGRPANASRPARRSLVEFALPAGDAPALVPPAPVLVPPAPVAAPTPLPTIRSAPEPPNEDQTVNPNGSQPTAKPAEATAEDDATFQQIEKLADEYRAKAFELMTANLKSTLGYADRLVRVKTPTEFSKLSASHACGQLETIIKQTAELGSIMQRLATAQVERVTSGFGKTPDESRD